MISVKRFCELEKIASRAVKQGDMKTLAMVNADEELRSANCQFIARDGKCWVGTLDRMEKQENESK